MGICLDGKEDWLHPQIVGRAQVSEKGVLEIDIFIYIYIYIRVCVRVCVCVQDYIRIYFFIIIGL